MVLFDHHVPHITHLYGLYPKKINNSGERKHRLVIDYRKLNSITIADKYPIPNINDTLAQLGGNTFFSVIDLKSWCPSNTTKNDRYREDSFFYK